MSLLQNFHFGPSRSTVALMALPILLTSLGASAYNLYIAFPSKPEAIRIHPGLGSLPKSCRSWEIYPEETVTMGSEGAYAQLPFGKVKYWLMGPADGVKVTLIAGLSIPAIIWQHVAAHLVARGFRVLIYDLYGRGYSDAPEVKYDLALYVTQLALLLQHLKWEKTDLVGISMGGTIAVAFVDAFPQLVSSHVTLIASAGILEASDLPTMFKFISSPFFMTLGNWYIRYRMKKLVFAKPTADLNPITEITRLQSAFLPYFNHAVASSVRSDSVRGRLSLFSSPEWERNGITPDQPKKVLFLHGMLDRLVPAAQIAQVQALLPPSCREQSRILAVEEAGHDLTINNADVVGKELVAFLLGGR